MRLMFDLAPGLGLDLPFMRGAVAEAATGALRAAGAQAKQDLRAAVRGGGFKPTPAVARARGQNFGKSFQVAVYPRRGKATSPGLYMVAKAGFAAAFATGAAISGRPWLVVPLPPAVKLGLDRAYRAGAKGMRLSKVADVEAARAKFGPLRPIRSRSGRVLAIDAAAARAAGLRVAKKRTIVPLFALVRDVRLPKRLDWEGATRRVFARLPDLYARALDEALR